MLSDQKPENLAANITFAMAVLERALTGGEAEGNDSKQGWLAFDYNAGQGLLMLVKEIQRARLTGLRGAPGRRPFS